jgi:Tfp pilus assembly protein PilF
MEVVIMVLIDGVLLLRILNLLAGDNHDQAVKDLSKAIQDAPKQVMVYTIVDKEIK